ncbi:MAG TPA: hypothetical protein VHX13_04190 [Acidobacteriaceae bacterium]|jgi:hypothetical protein|nr:hypothetical protein [Acidobacteriaceae bacterium]
MTHIAAYPEIIAPRWGAEEREYQTVAPKQPWVHGTGKNNALIHRIRVVRLRWWTCGRGGKYLIRLQSPRMMAVTNCGQWITIDSTRGKVCNLPKADAVICAACMGKGRNFPRHEKHEVPLALAKVRLGCVEVPA